MRTSNAALAVAAILAAGLSAPAAAQTRVTLKSAASSSSYYVMMVQIGEALKEATKGEITATVEESQGSVQNVKEAGKRPGNFVFTTPPSLLAGALAGKKPFEGETGYERVRTLFVVPAVTVHLAVRADSGVKGIADLAGKDFLGGGKGTFCERAMDAIFKTFDLTGKVNVIDVELSQASAAVKNRKVAGFATCSSHPTPQLQELATTTAMQLVSFSPEQQKQILALDPSYGPITIAKGTYKGIDADVQTVGLPVGGYATTDMPDDVAYRVTKVFWERRAEMAKQSAWWNGVDPKMVGLLRVKLHPGAARYYKETGVAVPAEMN